MKALYVEAIRSFSGVESLRSEWRHLVDQAQCGCPFVHPTWSIAWAHHYLDESELYFVVVRVGDSAGELIGVAPLYRRDRSVAGVTMRSLVPVGAGQGEALTEVMQVLAPAGRNAEVLRAIVGYLEAHKDADWAEISLGPEQGWLLPQWIENPSDVSLVHTRARACIVLDDLPEQPDEVLRGLKRNLRESLRRARNRSAKLGGIEISSITEPGQMADAVTALIDLHRKRSRMPGKVLHPDMLTGRSAEFLRDVAVQMAHEGLARVHLAKHDGVAVAAQLTVSDGYADYLSVSGLDPDYWDLNLNTLLVYEAVVDAVRRGRRYVNLSAGPNIAKSRWSSTIKSYNDFTLVHQRRRSRLLHGVYQHAVLARDSRNMRVRHRVKSH